MIDQKCLLLRDEARWMATWTKENLSKKKKRVYEEENLGKDGFEESQNPASDHDGRQASDPVECQHNQQNGKEIREERALDE